MKLNANLRTAALEYLAAEPATNLYLLVDSAGLPGLYRKLPGSSLQWMSLFEGTREAGALVAAPVLILIGSTQDLKISKSLLEWISEKCAYTSSIIMLASPQKIETVKRRLTRRLNVRLSGDMDAMLRFYDPRILEQLLKSLSVEQAKYFFAPGTKWWFVGRSGSLSGCATEFSMIDGAAVSLSLEHDQECSLLDASEPDQVMHLLHKTAPQLQARLPLDKYEFIAKNIGTAVDNGLASTSDFTLYCLVALLHGENFVTLPYWSDGLSNVRARRMSFSEVVVSSPDIEF